MIQSNNDSNLNRRQFYIQGVSTNVAMNESRIINVNVIYENWKEELKLLFLVWVESLNDLLLFPSDLNLERNGKK